MKITLALLALLASGCAADRVQACHVEGDGGGFKVMADTLMGPFDTYEVFDTAKEAREFATKRCPLGKSPKWAHWSRWR